MKTVAGCLALALCLMAAAAETPSGDPTNGKRLFMAYGCYECHGTTGAGGGFAGPRLAPKPLPFLAVESKLRTVSGRMPVYSENVLTDTQIADIYAYLVSIPTGKSSREIEMLNH